VFREIGEGQEEMEGAKSTVIVAAAELAELQTPL
jgi:hypothetical protein